MHVLIHGIIRLFLTLVVLPFWLQQQLMWGIKGSKFSDKKVLTVLWWNEKTIKRVSDFIAKINHHCTLQLSYCKRHQKRVYFAVELGKFLDVHKKTHM